VYKNIFILHQNINGLLNKSDILSIHVQELMESNKSVDVICITEHNMKAGDEIHFAMSNFKLATHFSRDNRNGGSCILVRNIHKYVVLKDIVSASISNVIECSGIELIEHKIIVICVYRIPNYNLSTVKLFLDKLHTILSKVCHNKKKVFLCGDFNIDMLQRTTQSIMFKALLEGYNLKLGVLEPTRLSSNTCIDNICHNVSGSKAEVLELAISDHTAQLMKCPVKKTCKLSHWYIMKRDYNVDNISKFVGCLEKLNFNGVYMTDNANEAYNSFMDDFELFYKMCFPYKKNKI
jgi:hypothetical protein